MPCTADRAEPPGQSKPTISTQLAPLPAGYFCSDTVSIIAALKDALLRVEITTSPRIEPKKILVRTE